jgi:hypothetical protein
VVYVNTLEEFTVAACRAVDVTPVSTAEQRLVLDLARDVAHGVARPAAPLSAYLLGLAVGRGADPSTAAQAIKALVPDQPAS